MKQDTTEIRGVVKDVSGPPSFCVFLVGNQRCEYKGSPRPSIGDSVVVVGRRYDNLMYQNAIGQNITYSMFYADSVTIE